MSNVTRFPSRLRPVDAKLVSDEDLAAAQRVTGFFAYSLPGLQSIAGLIEGKLAEMTDDVVDAIYGSINETIEGGNAVTEEHLLYEIVTEEVARRCMIRGIPTPWAEDSEAEMMAAIDEALALDRGKIANDTDRNPKAGV